MTPLLRRLSPLLVFAAALTFGAACGKSVDCSSLTVDRCGTTLGCLPLSGVPLRYPDDPTRTCQRYDDTQFIGCGAQLACDRAQPSVTLDANGKPWLVSSPCLPTGWTQTPASPAVASCPECGGLTVAACGGVDYCETFDGQPIDRARQCLLAPQTVGCHTKVPGCGPNARLANDPSGDTWYFAMACYPVGWQMLNVRDPAFPVCAATDGGDGGATDADSPSDGAVACEAVAPSACAARPDCFMFRASPIDPIRSCTGPAEAVACASQPDGGGARTCGAAITIASDPHGFRWVFPNTCIPAGWTHPTMPPTLGPTCPSDAGTGG